MYPQPPAAVDSPRPASSTAISPATRASRVEACRNRSVPRWHSCCQPSTGRSSRLRSRLGRAVWPRAWVSSRCAGRETGFMCQVSRPNPQGCPRCARLGITLSGPSPKPASPPQEPKSAYCRQSLVEGTTGFQTPWLLPCCIKQNKPDLPLKLLKRNRL